MDVDNRSRGRRLLGMFLVGTLFALLAGTSAASAQTATLSEPASIVVFKLEGDAADDDLRNELTGAMREQVQGNSRYELVNDDPVVLSDVVVVLGCDSASTSCLGKAADHFGADYLIFGKFESVGQRNRVSVRLFDPSRGRYVRSFGRVLEKLSPPYQSFREEVDGLLETDRQREAREQKQDVTSIRVTANVDDAEVRLNGQVVGKTPMERRGISPGKYSVEVTRSGYQSWKTVVQLEEGSNFDIQATLDETPDDDTGSSASASRDSTDVTRGEGPVDGMEPADDPSSERPSAQKAKTASWGPWVAIGMGGASLIGAGVQGARVQSLENELGSLRRQDPRPEDFDSREADLLKRGKNAELSQWILVGVGSVTASGGLLWLLFRNAGESGDRADRRFDLSFTGNGFQAKWRW